uniref:Uncharacterized protein n=3 Tax=Parascaris univalens TaxID=6257 RepID=A0A915CEF1_PARUN
ASNVVSVMSVMAEGANLSELFQSGCEYFFYETRLRSFTDRWPHRNPELIPQKMAEAGFFYRAEADEDDDCVQCPFCLKELTGWEPGDDPFIEHKKRQDRCLFMRLGKLEEDLTVRDFVRLIAQRRAAIMEAIYVETLELAERAQEKTEERIRKLVEKATKKDHRKIGGRTSKYAKK